MAENNMTFELDDNTREVLPAGDYHFVVTDYEVGYAKSTKLPDNTQQITVFLDIPHFDQDGDLQFAKVKKSLFVAKKTMFVIRSFAEAIGLAPEKGKINFDVTKTKGRSGVCQLSVFETNNGNEINTVDNFYPPSKAPLKTANDEAFAKKDAFLDATDKDGVPFA